MCLLCVRAMMSGQMVELLDMQYRSFCPWLKIEIWLISQINSHDLYIHFDSPYNYIHDQTVRTEVCPYPGHVADPEDPVYDVFINVCRYELHLDWTVATRALLWPVLHTQLQRTRKWRSCGTIYFCSDELNIGSLYFPLSSRTTEFSVWRNNFLQCS